MAALGSMLTNDGMMGPACADNQLVNPLAAKEPHFDPKAKACIFIFMAGAPSHLDFI